MPNLIAWDMATDSAVTPEREPEHLEFAKFPNGMKKQYRDPSMLPPLESPDPIRVITVSAMQNRFEIDEEAAILDGNDTKSKVFMSRLLNAKNINLESERVSKGLDYVLSFLDGEGKIHENKTPEERKIELLKDGTEEERWP